MKSLHQLFAYDKIGALIRDRHYSVAWKWYYKLFFWAKTIFPSPKFGQPCSLPEAYPKAIATLFPKYMIGTSLFETGDELVQALREAYPNATLKNVFYDEDDFIGREVHRLREIVELEPSLFVYMYGPNPSFSLSLKYLRQVASRIKGHRIILATDSLRLSHSYVIDRTKANFDQIVCLDAAVRFGTHPAQNVGPTPACISLRTFNLLIKPRLNIERDIDVLVMGTLYRERVTIVDLLRMHGVNVHTSGGEYGDKRLSLDEYWRVSCRAKIRIVTSFTEDRTRQINFDLPQMKAHLTETVASGALLIVDSKDPTSTYFNMGTEFLSYSSLDELVSTVKFYLADDQRRLEIAEAAHRRFIDEYLGSKFWTHVVNADCTHH